MLISLTEKYALVDCIYDGVLENPPWNSFLQLLRKTLNCQVSSMWFRTPFTDQSKRPLSDIDENQDNFTPLLFEKFHQHSSIFQAAATQGEVTLFSETLSRETIKSSEFYSDYLHPHNIIDGMQLFIKEPNGLEMWVELGRAKGKPLFGEDDKVFCQQLIPYLKRALGIYSILKSTEIKSKTYTEVIEQLSIGVVTLDLDRRVVDINVMANNLLSHAGCMKKNEPIFQFSKPDDQELFYSSFKKVISDNDNEKLPPGIEVFRIEQNSGQSLGFLVRHIAATPWYEGRERPAVVMYVCDPSLQRDTRENFVAKIFGLMMSEAALAIKLADGLTLSEAAKKLSITENSARTISKRIFAKTGTRRQAELVRLILNSVVILG
jgi:DNA-binding CsgD family transcriptional regulator